MIVQRLTVRYKLDKVDEAISLLKEEFARANLPHAVRFYTPKVGANDMSIGEFEFESFAEMEQFWSDWEARPETVAFHAKYRPLIEPGMVSEVFNLH